MSLDTSILMNDDYQYRPAGRSARSGRSQADHDVFEGLPIKQWRQSETTVGLPQVAGETKLGDNAWPELPMPRDSHLLSAATQALLREARRPRLAKRKEQTDDEKGEDEEDGEKETQTGFLAKKWSHVPAHLEEPEREYLAKRRKGLPSLHTTLALQAAINLPANAATRKAKIMKADAEGNTTVYEVLVPEGQIVEGEVQQDTEMADSTLERAAPGTVIDGVGIANAEGVIVANDLLQPQAAPPRRRNMPPKRVKKGGPGRGKKKVMFTADGQAGNSTPGGTGATSTPATGEVGAGEAMDIDSATKDGEDGEGDDDDDDDDREEGEVSDGEGLEEIPLPPADSALPSEANAPLAESPSREDTTSPPKPAPEDAASPPNPAPEDTISPLVPVPEDSASPPNPATEDTTSRPTPVQEDTTLPPDPASEASNEEPETISIQQDTVMSEAESNDETRPAEPSDQPEGSGAEVIAEGEAPHEEEAKDDSTDALSGLEKALQDQEESPA